MSEFHHVPSGAGSGALKDEAEMEREAERKRKRSEICRASRKRIKQDKNAFDGHIAELKAEITEKKKTSTSLELKRNMRSVMRKQLKKTIIERQRRMAELKKEEDGLNKQLEALSKHPNFGQNVGCDSLTVEMWRNELTVRSQTDWVEWAAEKTDHGKEISELGTKNSKLKFQMRVLTESIVHIREQGNP